MDPRQNNSVPTNNNPPPQIIKPGSDGEMTINHDPAPQPEQLPVPPAQPFVPQDQPPMPQTFSDVKPPQPTLLQQAPMPQPGQFGAEPSLTRPIEPEPLGQQAAVSPQPPTPPYSPNPDQFFQPDSNSQFGGGSFSSNTSKGFIGLIKRRKFVFGVGTALIILIISGAVFGLYLPNKPDNVWKTGLSRSGKAVDKLISQATDKKQLEALKKSEIIATLDINSQSLKFSGSFNAKFDTTKANGNLSFSSEQTGGSAQALSLKFLSERAKDAVYPDTYIQISGIKKLGLDSFAPELGGYDGKWIAINESYLKSLGLPIVTAKQDKNQINADDIAELTRAASSTTTQYLLTSDKNKAILEERSFVGKEKTDGVSTYHYKVGINKSHVKDYCQALINNVVSTNAYKKLPGVEEGNIERDKRNSITDCQSSADKDIKDSDTFDLWMDAKYKLIYKVRFYDETNKQAYTDVGQIYKGGDNLSLFVNYHDGKSKSDVKFTVNTNIKTNDSKGILSVMGGEGNDTYSGSITFEARQYTGEINVEKPADAIPIQDILKKYGVDPAEIYGQGVTSSSSDTKKKSDINMIMTNLEVYYAQNGFYPSFSDMNNSSWRAANMKSLEQSLQGSSSPSISFASSASNSQYGYAPSGCNSAGEKCSDYKLTALLSTGAKFEKSSVNSESSNSIIQ